ncbi:hypothetical protein AAF712_000689 [Marasmius tenuissimus]|uniref:Transmembrane protein n=1 Tax=Marasmius tenuissimus TaxID=585030 RepID=A0ABR3AEF6_9AGAR
MPSFRALTALFFIGASFTSTLALPHDAPTAPTACDATCVAKTSPVPVIIQDVQNKISPMVEKIQYLKECKADDLKPIVADITAIIDGATAKVRAYVDAKVDLNIALAAEANAKAGVAVSIDVFVGLFVSLVTSIVVCIKAALNVTAQVELDTCIKIFASLCISLCAFLQVCCQLVVGLAVALAVQLTAFVALCAKLGVDASVTAFLKVVL